MASYVDQLAAAKTANQAANALEEQMRAAIVKAFDDWDAGTLTNQSVRYQLERVVRTAFRSAASVAGSQVARQSELPGWKPQEQVFSPEYLKKLLVDVRRNLATYKASGQDPDERRRAVNNISHSAGVGVHAGFTAQQIASYRELQDFGMQVRKFWSANFDGHEPCVWCRQLHGTEVGLREQFDNPNPKAKTYLSLYGPPLHPNCFVGDTVVSGRAVFGASRRLYEGELVELQFGEGRSLTGTPNHPILTTRGWVGLGDLVQGDQLLSDRSVESLPPGPPAPRDAHHDQAPARIEDVAKAFSGAPGVVSVQMPVAAPDFHGDGTEGQVAVVHTDGTLWDDLDAEFFEPLPNLRLLDRNVHRSFLLDVLRSGEQLLLTAARTADRLVRRRSDRLVLLRGPASTRELCGGFDASGRDARFSQQVDDWLPRYAESLCEAQDALAFKMSADDVLRLTVQEVESTRHYYGSVPVYNLETAGGWYTANGIIAHNCQCFLVTFITTLENAGQEPDLDTPSPAPQSMDTTAVQSMPLAIFNAVMAVLRKVLALVRGK